MFNHRMGADDKEEVMATEEMGNNRNVDISEPKLIEAWTKYNFDARKSMVFLNFMESIGITM